MSNRFQPIELQDVSSISPDDQPGAIVISDNLPSLNVLSLHIQNNVQHVVQKSNFKSGEELEVSKLMMNDPSCFIDFPLSSILGEQKPSRDTEKKFTDVSIVLENVLQKKLVLQEIESYLKSFTNSRSFITDVLTAADEIITNSVYNAPYIQVNAAETGPDRDFTKVKIDPSKKPYIFMGKDNDRLIVGCRDLYGTLNTQHLISRIRTCYERNPGEAINFGPGGAGIGSFLIFDSCISLYVAVDSGVSTTICCSFPLKISATRRSQIPKNLHVIQRDHERT
jgi:hypothetical protein